MLLLIPYVHVLITQVAHLAQNMSGAVLAAPEPGIQAPPGMGVKTDLLLSWLKWGGTIGGVAGFMIAGIMMAVGRRNRSTMAADAASGLPWILGGLSVVALAGGLVGAVLG